MILVVGATGLVGAEVCRRLTKRGEVVKAFVRTTSSPEKVAFLKDCGAELCVGDLKDPASLARACSGVTAVISTASSTLSRQAGDSIESVDERGQLSLVEAAQAAGIDRFIFVSFRHPPAPSFPLADAKAQVEKAIAGMNYTIIQASWFMEVWLSPALGFDYAHASARVYGPGTSPVSWVSSHDIAEICVLASKKPIAERRTLEVGGPDALSPLQVISRFEEIGGRPFKVEHVSEQALRAQFNAATDPMQKSFAALMLGYLSGDAMDVTPIRRDFAIELTSVEQYARSVLGSRSHPSIA
ncbi:MAG TPA: SDR family oxidoreductase [Terracidiphilus sp.]|jgi:uncharacterized protein YbjT (DUF2867 family)